MQADHVVRDLMPDTADGEGPGVALAAAARTPRVTVRGSQSRCLKSCRTTCGFAQRSFLSWGHLACVLRDAVPTPVPHPSTTRGTPQAALMVFGPALDDQGVDGTVVCGLPLGCTGVSALCSSIARLELAASQFLELKGHFHHAQMGMASPRWPREEVLASDLDADDACKHLPCRPADAFLI